MQVGPGARVTIYGLSSKPELNGTSGVLLGPSANGRVTVRLDSGTEIALKPANLGIAGGGAGPAGGASRCGGMPGFGGMPGRCGGLPGFAAGMANLQGLGAAAGAAVQRKLAELGVALPPGMTPGHAAAAAAAAALAALYFASRAIPVPVLALVGLLAYGGTATQRGKAVLSKAAARASSSFGRPLQAAHLLAAFCVVVALMGTAALSGSSTSSATPSPPTDIYVQGLREAYQHGYDDALAGLEPRPPLHIPGPELGAPGGGGSGSRAGWGLGTLVRYGTARASASEM